MDVETNQERETARPAADTRASGIEGRVALVTGAAGGIGRAVVSALEAAGAVLAAVDADESALSEVYAEGASSGAPPGAGGPGPAVRATVPPLRQGWRPPRPFVADVRDAEAVERCVDAVERDLGPIDLLVNVAGVLRIGAVTELAEVDWDLTLAVNAGGVFHASKAVARRMQPRSRGCIVTVTSNAAMVPRAGMAAYAASKAASTMLTTCLGLELAQYGIRCNVVAPGSTMTRMQRDLWESGQGEKEVLAGSLDTYRVGIPLGRIADPCDIADAVVFLASDRARHITMQHLVVDGGAALGA